MAKSAIERTVQLSLLDRLLDDDPKSSVEKPVTRDQSIALLRHAVARDLEWLLNTRRTPEPAPESLLEVTTSVYHYGLPDLTSLSKDSIEDRSRLLRMIEETITAFEPRLAEVRVVVSDNVQPATREFHFRIEGLLRMDPSPERVAFDTRLEVPTGRFALDPGDHA